MSDTNVKNELKTAYDYYKMIEKLPLDVKRDVLLFLYSDMWSESKVIDEVFDTFVEDEVFIDMLFTESNYLKERIKKGDYWWLFTITKVGWVV